MKNNEIIDFDKNHIWHPYTSMLNPIPAYNIVSAQGVKLKLENGKELIDGMSSWWATIHGYRHPELDQALKEQIDKMSHIMFGGLTHEPAVQLAKLLINITPKPLEKVFFSDSGSVAVEVAMKMALQYQYSNGKTNKNKFLTIRSGYHGDTFNAMSVCDPITGMHEIFKDILPKNYFADSPKCSFYDQWDKNDINSFENLLKNNHNNIAAVIMEPIVQGAGGMKFFHPQYLKEVRNLCDKFDILLIFDEIATGFGRTGKLFACEHANISPDIICLGKAITAGYMSFAATITTEKVANGISSGKAPVFMHGPTFMGNPLACSVALKSITLLLESDWQTNIKRIETKLKDELKIASSFSSVKNVRVLGAIGVIEMKKDVNVSEIQKIFVEKGVWIRPFGKLIYIMPPYIITNDELTFLTKAIIDTIKDF